MHINTFSEHLISQHCNILFSFVHKRGIILWGNSTRNEFQSLKCEYCGMFGMCTNMNVMSWHHMRVFGVCVIPICTSTFIKTADYYEVFHTLKNKFNINRKRGGGCLRQSIINKLSIYWNTLIMQTLLPHLALVKDRLKSALALELNIKIIMRITGAREWWAANILN